MGVSENLQSIPITWRRRQRQLCHSPSHAKQALKRLHRRGQTREILVYRFICAGEDTHLFSEGLILHKAKARNVLCSIKKRRHERKDTGGRKQRVFLMHLATNRPFHSRTDATSPLQLLELNRYVLLVIYQRIRHYHSRTSRV